MTDSKKVTIEGLNNKYLMKKVMGKLPTEPVEKKKLNLNIKYTDDENLFLLSSLENLDKFKLENYELYEIIKKNILNKRNGYRAQDIKKNVFLENEFITIDQILNLIITNKLKCYYCNQTCLLFYKYVREPKQWTLDRIDNSIGHNMTNVVISCLQCNLKRRNKDKDKFFQGSNMILVKLN